MPRLPEGEHRIPEGMNRVCTKSVESEVHPCTLEFAERIVFIKGRCPLLLRELLSLGVEYQGQMHVAGSLGTERLDELDLTRRVVEQVGAAHHVGDALMNVVDDGGELIGPEAVRTLEYEVADFVFNVLCEVAAKAVGEGGGS
mgnify:FL=1